MSETMNPPSHVIATIFGLSAFSVAVLSGLAAGAAPTGTLVRAVLVMAIFHFVGNVVGLMIERIVREVAPPIRTTKGVSGKYVDNSMASSNNAG
jgi:putative Mn2+ efflux pump MntP